MAQPVIKKENIKALIDRLTEVVTKRKEGLNEVLVGVNFTGDLSDSLEAIAANAQKQCKKEQQEIRNMEDIIKKLSRLTIIDSDSATYDEDILPYVEGDSIVSMREQNQEKTFLELLKEKLQSVADDITAYVKEGKYKQREQNKELREDRKKVEIDKDAVAILDPLKKDLRVQIKVDETIGGITNIPTNPKDEEEYVSELIIAEKQCEICHAFSRYALILDCRCAICIKCVKENLFKEGEKPLKNTFDAHKKFQSSMCACPTHSYPIDIGILEEICGEEVIERASLDAMRKQVQECILAKKYYPTLCMGCKVLIPDETNVQSLVTLCSKHKICTSCKWKRRDEYKYSKKCEFCNLVGLQ